MKTVFKFFLVSCLTLLIQFCTTSLFLLGHKARSDNQLLISDICATVNMDEVDSQVLIIVVGSILFVIMSFSIFTIGVNGCGLLLDKSYDCGSCAHFSSVSVFEK